MLDEKNKAENAGAKEEITDSEKSENENSAASEEKENPETENDESKSTAKEAPEKESKKEASKLKNENKKLLSELDEKKKAYDELNDRYMRMIAEYDNFRKRSQKEREGTYSAAYADALTEFLPMADNLERALAYKDSENFTKGIEMIVSQFSDTLKKLGIEAYGERGDTFDPNLHNAVMRTEDDSLGENTVADVLMKGYRRDGKVIRHAMVKVAN